MSWERKALEKVILLAVEKDKEFEGLFNTLNDLGIHVNFDSSAYEILREITDWELLPENMESFQGGFRTKEEFVSVCLEYIEKNFSK